MLPPAEAVGPVLHTFRSVNPPHWQWPAPMGSWPVDYCTYISQLLINELFDFTSQGYILKGTREGGILGSIGRVSRNILKTTDENINPFTHSQKKTEMNENKFKQAFINYVLNQSICRESVLSYTKKDFKVCYNR